MAIKRVGLIGGGQLASMLCEAAHNMGLKTRILGSSLSDPARNVSDEFILIKNPAWPWDFFEGLDALTFENEFFPGELESEIQKQQNSGLKVFPSLGTIQILRNKLEQKRLFKKLGLLSSPFLESKVLEGEDFEDFIRRALSELGADLVFKWGLHGYDGKGVFFVDETKEKLNKAKIFYLEAKKLGVPLYAEKKIKFSTEAAVVALRNINNEICFYPFTQVINEEGVCRETLAPLEIFYPVQQDELNHAKYTVQKLLEQLSYVGAMGVEFFITDQGFLINEVAPRVHNTGHYTQDSLLRSQFEGHLSCIMGHAFTELKLNECLGMLNLLGPKSYLGPAVAPSFDDTDLKLHWYNKDESRPLRKLGHVNYKAENKEKFFMIESSAKFLVKQWAEALSKGELK